MTRTVRHMYRGVAFEWDAAKATSNLLKHGVSFELACEAFFDPIARVIGADAQEEARDAVIGRAVSQAVLFVVHVLRHEEEVARIISARHATLQECRIYEQL